MEKAKDTCENLKKAQFTVRGQVPSKSNSYRVIRLEGHGAVGKTDALVRYETAFFMQCPIRGAKIGRRFRLAVDVYYSSDRPDLDNSLKAILDCLQTCRAITNDRLCAEIHARKFVDKADPRAEIEITELM